MSTQAGPVPSGRLADQRQSRAGGPTLITWVAVVVALIAGAVGGYFLAPTKTVTNTNTVTVAPEAYTTSNQVQAQAAFNAATCTYTGPAELKAGTALSISYTTTEPDAAVLSLYNVSAGTTWEQMIQAANTVPANTPPSFVNTQAIFNSSPSGASTQTLTSTALPAGLWVVGCATTPDSSNKMYVATILRVVGS